MDYAGEWESLPKVVVRESVQYGKVVWNTRLNFDLSKTL